jgi:hypothetical protein
VIRRRLSVSSQARAARDAFAALAALTVGIAACDRAVPPIAFTTDTLTIVGEEPTALPIQRRERGRPPAITRIRLSTDSAVTWHQSRLNCRGDGDAEVTAWSREDSASLLVRCRLAAYFGGAAFGTLFTTDAPRAVRIWARLYSRDSILVAPISLTTTDTSIVRFEGVTIRPVAVGRARFVMELPGKTIRSFAEVHERIADETLTLSAGEFRTWRLGRGRYEIWMKALENSPNSAWMDITTEGARCMRDSREEDTIHCFVRDSGALAIRHLGTPDPRTKRLGVRVVRNP